MEPVRQHIEVSVDAARAWVALTEEIGRWWPLATHSATNDPEAALAFTDTTLVETAPDGTEHVWGTVTAREEPHVLRTTWHPGGASGPGETDVEWQITPLGGLRTRIGVVHRGWTDELAAARAAYETGWIPVLGALAALLEEDEQPEHWYVLSHSPGPEWDNELGPGGQPGMDRHFEFLESLAEAGHLVGAGPLPDSPGCGQTLIRGVARERAVELATVVDEAVASGVLAVTVTPWLVVARG